MRTLLLTSVLVAGILSPVVARADVQACLVANEKGQRARAAGKLREAREAFLVCGADTCPALVRQDCTRWAEDVANRMPSVVLGAKDRGGRDVFDVKVTVDGAPLVEKLDGKSVPVDPGPHTFRFEAEGMPPVTEKILVKEGERAKPIDVVFDGGAPAETASGTGTGGSAAPGGVADGEPEPSKGPGPLPWIAMGLGGAGLVTGGVLYLAAPPFPSGCDSRTKVCTKGPNESTADFEEKQARAGRHDLMTTVGPIVMGAGAAVAIGGVIWYFVGSSGSKKQAATTSSLVVVPWLAGGTTGVAAAARF